MYTCAAESSIFVYKRQYKFRCRVWFYDERRDAWCEAYGRKMEGFFVNEITANEELISPVALGAQGKITNNPPAGLIRPTKPYDITSGPWVGAMLLIMKLQYPWIQR